MGDSGDRQGSGLKRVDLMLGSTCNHRCIFCYQNIFHSKDDQFDYGFENMQATLAQGRDFGYREVYISGGEPTLNDRLVELIGVAREMGYDTAKVMTNGIRISYPAYARRLVDAGLTNMAVSFHGHSAAIHNRHTRFPNSFDFVLQGLTNMIQMGELVRTEVNMVVTRHNVNHLVEFARMLSELGVQDVHFQHVVPNSPPGRQLAPAKEDVCKNFRRVVDECREQIRMTFAFVPYCWMRGYDDYVPGFDFTTPFFSNCIELFERWRDSLLAAKVVLPECLTCKDFDCCRGFWKTD